MEGFSNTAVIFIEWTLKPRVLDKESGHSGEASNRIKSSDAAVNGRRRQTFHACFEFL